ncbi:MAG: TspO/MBR family protein, partial [Myxococcota bacterium]
RTLANPSWAPPGPVIGTVWVVLFALMGLALYVLDRDGTGRDSTGRARSAARAAILAQYAVCMAWTGLYFGLRNVPNGFRVTVVAWLLGALCLALAWRASRRATYLLLPLQGWLTFALGLSWTVWQLNR